MTANPELERPLKARLVVWRSWRVEEALTYSDVPVAFVKDNCSSEEEETFSLKTFQSATERHPKAEDELVVQVTLPAAYVRPVENVVVATQSGKPFTLAKIVPFAPIVRAARTFVAEP